MRIERREIASSQELTTLVTEVLDGDFEGVLTSDGFLEAVFDMAECDELLELYAVLPLQDGDVALLAVVEADILDGRAGVPHRGWRWEAVFRRRVVGIWRGVSNGSRGRNASYRS